MGTRGIAQVPNIVREARPRARHMNSHAPCGVWGREQGGLPLAPSSLSSTDAPSLRTAQGRVNPEPASNNRILVARALVTGRRDQELRVSKGRQRRSTSKSASSPVGEAHNSTKTPSQGPAHQPERFQKSCVPIAKGRVPVGGGPAEVDVTKRRFPGTIADAKRSCS